MLSEVAKRLAMMSWSDALALATRRNTESAVASEEARSSGQKIASHTRLI
jgi:hypothetical protein